MRVALLEMLHSDLVPADQPIPAAGASARYRTAVARNLLWRFYRSEALAPAEAHVLRYGT